VSVSQTCNESMSTLWRRCAWLLLSVACASCGQHAATVEFLVADGYRFSQPERSAIQRIADATALEVRRFLPTLPGHVVLWVRAGDHVIEETGETASAFAPNVVVWTVDPRRSGGVLSTVTTQLRQTLFHEFHHLVREMTNNPASLMDRAVTEGMATAFERDFAGSPAPWGKYPDNVSDWAQELMALPGDAPRDPWMTRHPDGRRWIASKVGTYLVDRAISASGKSSADLVSTPTGELISMALKQ
jgi:Predicted Zn-dependent protease (DUF2268)